MPVVRKARMVGTAAWLCDAVFPGVPVRQWVLSLVAAAPVVDLGERGREVVLVDLA